MVGRFQGFYTKTAMTTCTMHQYANEVCLQLDYLLSHLAVVEAIVAVGVVIIGPRVLDRLFSLLVWVVPVAKKLWREGLLFPPVASAWLPYSPASLGECV